MSESPAIQAHDLVRTFGDLVAVDHLTFSVAQGEIFGVLGHNGAGKTTTVRLLNGVLGASEGSARVLGWDPATNGVELRRRTGVLTETPSIEERLSARENLSLYASLYGVPEPQVAGRVEELLQTFDLAGRADEKAGGFSKGMKQRLALARALVHHPELLFLDEPTAGLDPVLARSVHDLIVQHSQQEGHTVFLCTHNLTEAQRLCHRVAVLGRGRLLAMGTPQELARQWVTSLKMTLETEPAAAPKAVVWLGSHGIEVIDRTVPGRVILQGVDRASTPDMIRAMADEGIPLFSVVPQEPTLEDVYFALEGQMEPES
jgi:ABC-2 type transport system ATP-binding protein